MPLIPIAFISETFMFMVVVVVAFGVLTLITSFVRFQMMTQRLKGDVPEDASPAEIFQLQVVRELGALHQSPEPFSVLWMAPARPPDIDMLIDQEGQHVLMREWADELRNSMRKKDLIMVQDGFACSVLAKLPQTKAKQIIQRVTDRLSRLDVRLPNGKTQRWGVHVGMVHYPVHGEKAADLVAEAQQALVVARGTVGGALHVPGQDAAPVEEADTEQAGTPPKNVKALLDELTGVLRAERLGTALQRMLARQRKDGEALSVVYFAIDNFKQYQDHYKREASDHVLKSFADMLSVHTRETDILARAAESEFVAVMGCPPREAFVAAQRLVAEIKRTPIRLGTLNLKVSVCAGVAGFPDHSAQPRELLVFAQTATAQAQARGRSSAALYQVETQRKAQPTRTRPLDSF